MEQNPEEADLPDWADALIQATRGILEPRQRMTKLVETLQNKNPREIAQFIHNLPRGSNPNAQRLHLDLVRFRDDLQSLGYDRLLEIYEHAKNEAWSDVLAFLRSNPAFGEEYESVPEGYSRKLGALTVGEKKQLSLNKRRKNIEMLVFDSSAMVIAQLLLNPAVTEKDVVRIAARHQAPPKILEEICRSDRWIRQYRVMKALVFNPRTPLSFALGFLQHLKKEDLQILVSGGSSRKELLAEARVRLKSR